MAFFPMVPPGNEKSEQESNPIPYPLYLYLPRSAFLVSFTDPNKQLPSIKYVLKFLDCGPSV